MSVTKLSRPSLFVVLVLATCFAAQAARASTLIVGKCKTGIQFTTISAAVASAPATGAVIEVCPGTYPEQVTISKSLTLKGIASGNSSAAIITSPNGGLQTNATGI